MIRLVIAALLGLVLGVGEAWGHAALLRSVPEDGAVLDQTPERAELVFNEPVSLVLLELKDSAGQERRLGGMRAEDARIVADLPKDVGQGSYILSYRVVSADGHPVNGAVAFAIGRAPTMPARPGGVDALDILMGTLRLAVYAAAVLACGGALFAAVVDRRGPAPLESAVARWAIILGIAALAGAASVDLVRLRASAPALPGATAAVGLALAWPGCGIAVRLVGVAAVALGLSLTGHAATAASIAPPLVTLHAVGAAFWVGSLPALLERLRAGPPADAARVLRRFSAVAVGAVALLVVSGTALGWLQLRSAEALWTTTYGRLLCLKLLLVAGLLGLAALNRWRLAPLAAAGRPQPLRRSIVAELALAAGVLAVTGALGSVPPPRATAPAILVRAEMGQIAATVASAGSRLSIGLSRGGAAFDPLEVAAEFSGSGSATLRRSARREATGVWSVADPDLPVVRLELLISDFEKIAVELRLRP